MDESVCNPTHCIGPPVRPYFCFLLGTFLTFLLLVFPSCRIAWRISFFSLSTQLPHVNFRPHLIHRISSAFRPHLVCISSSFRPHLFHGISPAFCSHLVCISSAFRPHLIHRISSASRSHSSASRPHLVRISSASPSPRFDSKIISNSKGKNEGGKG